MNDQKKARQNIIVSQFEALMKQVHKHTIVGSKIAGTIPNNAHEVWIRIPETEARPEQVRDFFDYWGDVDGDFQRVIFYRISPVADWKLTESFEDEIQLISIIQSLKDRLPRLLN